MRCAARWLGIMLTVGGIASCGNDDTSGPPPDELAGTWNATQIEFVSVANPATKVDLVPLGGSLKLELAAAGSCSVSFALPGEPPWVRTGTWTSSVDVLSLHYTVGGENEFDMTLNGNTLTLRGGDSDFDFNDDDQDEAAKLNLVLTRG